MIKDRIIKYYRLLLLIKNYFQILMPWKKIYILGTPIHDNLGDQAIIYAERKFLKDNFNGYHIVEIESRLTKRVISILNRHLRKNDIITLHGGGFIGSLWIEEEKMFREVCQKIKNTNITVFPQTIYFSNDTFGLKTYKESKKIYSENENLTIFCREKYSYEYLKYNMPNVSCFLVPDMALYLSKIITNFKRNNILFCIRKDKEKVDHNYTNIKSLASKYNLRIDYTDTILNKKCIFKFNRKYHLIKKLKHISKYKIMVTDRLHGMIFAYLTNTPCLIFENKSHKIKGVYEWIAKSNKLMLISDNTDNSVVDKFISDNIKKNNDDFTMDLTKFDPLIYRIKNHNIGRQ